MRKAGLRAAVLTVAIVGALLSAGAFAGGSGNPANHPSVVNKPIEDYRYDRATRCKSKVPKGTKRLVRWLERNVRGQLWGITRCERLSPGNYSLHADGRAIDWALDARNRKQKRAGMRLIRKHLLADDRRGNDNALARRMGVQGIIFDCRSWWSGPGGLGRYGYCYKDNGKRKKNLNPTAAHVDHIHLELSKPGSRAKTSFWRSKISRR